MGEKHHVIEMGGERLVIKLGFPEIIGFVGSIGCLGALSALGLEYLQSLWGLCALFAFISAAFFKKSSINLCMPERLGILGFLGYLGYIPGIEFLKGLFGLYFFFGFLGVLGHRKKHFYCCAGTLPEISEASTRTENGT
jgi:hypothetical protein